MLLTDAAPLEFAASIGKANSIDGCIPGRWIVWITSFPASVRRADNVIVSVSSPYIVFPNALRYR